MRRTPKKPWNFYPELSEANLRPIAEALLDVRYDTLKDLSTPLDCNYTREAAVFGRQRNMLIMMARETASMSLVHAGMDVTFKLGTVPIRFFTDNPDNPQKQGFFRRNQVDDLFSIEDSEPVMWRFVIEKASGEDDSDRVYFIGFNAFQERVSEWEYRSGRGGLQSVAGDVPPVVPIAPAKVGLKPRVGGGSKVANDEE